jgi:polysaccharide biosynthesis protein PslH
MRAHATSEALRHLGKVDVIVPPRSDCSFALQNRFPALGRALFKRPADWPGDTVSLRTPREHYDRIHVFRLANAPWARRFLGTARCELDLDESESQTRLGVAAVLSGEAKRRLLFESTFYREKESAWLPRFDRVHVSSRIELNSLRQRFPELRASYLPNTVPAREVSRRVRDGALRALFLGNWNYPPNRDAAEFLTTEIRPLLPADEVEFWLAGSGSPPPSSVEGVRSLGFVPDLECLYPLVDAAVIPLRAGGGTRIKILEALSRGLPVVSTTLGAAGLDLTSEEHLLLADTPADFASACSALHRSTSLSARLGDAGRAHVREAHAAARLVASLA